MKGMRERGGRGEALEKSRREREGRVAVWKELVGGWIRGIDRRIKNSRRL